MTDFCNLPWRLPERLHLPPPLLHLNFHGAGRGAFKAKVSTATGPQCTHPKGERICHPKICHIRILITLRSGYLTRTANAGRDFLPHPPSFHKHILLLLGTLINIQRDWLSTAFIYYLVLEEMRWEDLACSQQTIYLSVYLRIKVVNWKSRNLEQEAEGTGFSVCCLLL